MSVLKKLKKHSLESLLALGIFAGSALAPSQDAKLQFNSVAKAEDAETSKTESLPHYLKDITVPSDPVENLFEKWRIYRSLSVKYPTDQNPAFINESIEVKKNILGKDVTLTFVGYVKHGDDIVHYTVNGTEKLSLADFELVVKDQTN